MKKPLRSYRRLLDPTTELPYTVLSHALNSEQVEAGMAEVRPKVKQWAIEAKLPDETIERLTWVIAVMRATKQQSASDVTKEEGAHLRINAAIKVLARELTHRQLDYYRACNSAGTFFEQVRALVSAYDVRPVRLSKVAWHRDAIYLFDLISGQPPNLSYFQNPEIPAIKFVERALEYLALKDRNDNTITAEAIVGALKRHGKRQRV